MNNIQLIGRLTKDPEFKYTPGGKAVVNFTLAVNRPFKNQSGENEADFILIQAWNKTAENIANFLKKGSQAAITGRLSTRNYENDAGQRVYVTEVVADFVQFLDTRQGNGQGQGQGQQQNNQQGGYNQNQQQGGYNNPGQQQGSYNQNQQQGGYNNNQGQQGGYPNQQGGPANQNQQGGFNQNQQGGFNQNPQNGYNQNQPPQGNMNDPFANNGPVNVSDDDLPF